MGHVLDSETREGTPRDSKREVAEPPACLRGLWFLCVVIGEGKGLQGSHRGSRMNWDRGTVVSRCCVTPKDRFS